VCLLPAFLGPFRAAFPPEEAVELGGDSLALSVVVPSVSACHLVVQRYDHANMHAAIKDQNLELLRERLIQTVRFQAEDSEGTPHE